MTATEKKRIDDFIDELKNRINDGNTVDAQVYFDGDCVFAVLPEDGNFKEVAVELCTKDEIDYLQSRIDAQAFADKLKALAETIKGEPDEDNATA